MAVRAKLLPSHLVPLILVPAVLGPGAVVVCSEQPLVDHADLSPPSPAADSAPSLKPPLDSAGSTAAPLAPAPTPRLFFWGDRPASPVATQEDGVDLRARLRRFPDYPVVENDRVQYFLDRFTGDQRGVIGRWLRRSSRYREMVRRTFRDRGLPEDLAFTAMIESGFDPGAVSRVGAKGLWQFMARTARLYGLRVDRWVDERLDPEKSTAAAAAYLGDLYKDFVPSIQAITLIARSPDRYGFEVATDSPPQFETVQAPPATDLRRLARAAGLPPGALRTLNPELCRGVTPPGAFYTLRVPPAAKDPVSFEIPASPERTVHVVRQDETLSQIAKKYDVSVTDIARWNKLGRLDRIQPGDRIRVASAPLPARVEVDQRSLR